ncbi:hypothetical protein QFZ66_004197 [Streptomyces sp. B4I13]|nr:hypothetical protein [Streptomyces sp. B4I13]
MSESTRAGDIAVGYAFGGPALDLGALLWEAGNVCPRPRSASPSPC